MTATPLTQVAPAGRSWHAALTVGVGVGEGRGEDVAEGLTRKDRAVRAAQAADERDRKSRTVTVTVLGLSWVLVGESD